jgi:hypothetical protein
MLLFSFLGLIVNSALFCDGCNIGTTDVKYFDWNKVDVSVMTVLLKQIVFIAAACFYTSFVVPLTTCQKCISELVRSSN